MVQPYLRQARGIESPVLVLRGRPAAAARRPGAGGGPVPDLPGRVRGHVGRFAPRVLIAPFPEAASGVAAGLSVAHGMMVPVYGRDGTGPMSWVHETLVGFDLETTGTDPGRRGSSPPRWSRSRAGTCSSAPAGWRIREWRSRQRPRRSTGSPRHGPWPRAPGGRGRGGGGRRPGGALAAGRADRRLQRALRPQPDRGGVDAPPTPVAERAVGRGPDRPGDRPAHGGPGAGPLPPRIAVPAERLPRLRRHPGGRARGLRRRPGGGAGRDRARPQVPGGGRLADTRPAPRAAGGVARRVGAGLPGVAAQGQGPGGPGGLLLAPAHALTRRWSGHARGIPGVLGEGLHPEQERNPPGGRGEGLSGRVKMVTRSLSDLPPGKCPS
ncbi:hypothetical protein ACFQZC_29735 [Streptacidiphilus monticola]